MALLLFLKALFILFLKNANSLSDSKFGLFQKNPVKYVCPNLELTEREGTVSSPFYPNNYPSHLSCSWHIQGRIGDIISLTLIDIDIEESCCCETRPCCLSNWLKLGPLTNGTEKKYCGNEFHYNTVSTNNSKLWIKFHISEFKHGGRGFQFHYKIGPPAKCEITDIKCPDNKCVPYLMRCNGYPDCEDGSDEFDCSNRCTSGRSCHSVFQCYEASKHCDGIADCEDLSDESDCFSCPPNLTRCSPNSTKCYDPQTQRCDRVLDCLHGEDEVDCSLMCPGKILCDSHRGCYSSKQRCNGVTQCEDASDEKGCVSDLCNYEHGGFLCDNGRCIQEIWTCDRTDDCGDGSDERSCLRNSVLTAALMGSLICALLLVIAISCTCRLHALRMLENRLSTRRETPLSRLSQEYFFREPPPSYAVAVQGDNPHQNNNLCVENLHYDRLLHPVEQRYRRRQRRLRYVRVTQRSPPGHPPPSASNVSSPEDVGTQTTQNPRVVPDVELLDDTVAVTTRGTPSRRRSAGKIENTEVGRTDGGASRGDRNKISENVSNANEGVSSETVSLETLSTDAGVSSGDNHFYCDSDVDPILV